MYSGEIEILNLRNNVFTLETYVSPDFLLKYNHENDLWEKEKQQPFLTGNVLFVVIEWAIIYCDLFYVWVHEKVPGI